MTDTTGLRERKKLRTRDTLEETALRLFAERGYERVRVEDVCAGAWVSERTFFRYFRSKEDLVLGRLRAHLAEAARLFADRPADEPVREALRAVIGPVARDYVLQPERELLRLRLVTGTPALATGLLDVFAGFERLVREFATTRPGAPADPVAGRLVAGAAVVAFRVGLELWIESGARADLPSLVLRNLDALTAGLPS